ncbi:MAG: hypothetical protein KKB77_09575 [Bacteroidetes bacterium]|nr:hypothetical protein [Bacteroidota bacterium]
MFKEFFRTPEFEKDMKKLLKRFRTLEEDLENFIKFGLTAYHKLKQDYHGIFHIHNTGFDEPKIYKAKKFACKSLKGKGVHSGIRVIYACFDKEDRVGLLEIYYKGEKGEGRQPKN